MRIPLDWGGGGGLRVVLGFPELGTYLCSLLLNQKRLMSDSQGRELELDGDQSEQVPGKDEFKRTSSVCTLDVRVL